jgi:hypothetical protein
MEYETELADAKKRLAAAGRNPDDFSFEMTIQPPDPDGGGMWTVRYDVQITDKTTGKSYTPTGGIGLRWVDAFEDALKSGRFA